MYIELMYTIDGGPIVSGGTTDDIAMSTPYVKSHDIWHPLEEGNPIFNMLDKQECDSNKLWDTTSCHSWTSVIYGVLHQFCEANLSLQGLQ